VKYIMQTDWNKQVNWEEVKMGLDKYVVIMENYSVVTRDLDWLHPDYVSWRKKYNHFYRVRRDEAFQREYYNIFRTIREQSATFEQVLKNVFLKTNRIEASFSSKLFATHYPDMPIWDSEVLKKLGMSPPKQHKMEPDRIQGIIKCYDAIADWYKHELNSERGIAMLDIFDKRIGKAAITDTKKIDLMLWQKDRIPKFKKIKIILTKK
jgi:hypothetical protein